MEYCIVNDEGVVEDGFYSVAEVSEALEQMTEVDPDHGCEVAERSDYDEDGDFIEDTDEDDEGY